MFRVYFYFEAKTSKSCLILYNAVGGCADAKLWYSEALSEPATGPQRQ
jgi:hypothetical protein